MTDREARSLKRGDRIEINGVRAVVERVASYSGPLGTAGPLYVDFEFMEGGTGRASGDFLKDIVKISDPPPSWYGDLMESGSS